MMFAIYVYASKSKKENNIFYKENNKCFRTFVLISVQINICRLLAVAFSFSCSNRYHGSYCPLFLSLS